MTCDQTDSKTINSQMSGAFLSKFEKRDEKSHGCINNHDSTEDPNVSLKTEDKLRATNAEKDEQLDKNKECADFPKIIVKKATVINYPSEEIYSMIHNPKGYALIINNKTFDYEEYRCGSEKDFDHLQQLFNGLDYEIEAYEDLTTEEMSSVFRKFAKKIDQSVQSCVIAIGSHGYGHQGILGTDGNYLDLDFDIIPYFNNDYCPALKNKPKIFFIQACRGDRFDDGVDVVDANDFHAALPQTRIPTNGDILIVQSTLPGYVANRHRIDGSWLFEAVVRIFSEYACSHDIETMLKMITNSIMTRTTYDGEMSTPEIILRGWRKKLYFNPGKCA